MSKKAFMRALDLARAGDLDAALREIESLDRAFVSKRFNHYAAQPDQRQAALQLRAAWDARQRFAPSTEAHVPIAPFTAPLAQPMATAPTAQVSFDQPSEFLAWVSADWNRIDRLALREFFHVDVWALAGLACLSFPERPRRPPLDSTGTAGVAPFAHAVGLTALLSGEKHAATEASRTMPLRRVRSRAEVEPTAEEMTRLLANGSLSDDVRLALKYVLVELLRNVVQHSEDPLGAVAAAQRMGPAQRRESPMIQLVVADAGIGIPAHLKRSHPRLVDYRQALERALLPHISGTFEEGFSGSYENAGLGLYMISELARETRGRLLIATHGAALVLQADAQGRASPKFLEPSGMGFPGTLVAFELPSGAVADYQALMQRILRKAQERTPRRVSDRWLQFGPAEAHAVHVLVSPSSEDTTKAAELSERVIRPAVLARATLELDFAGLQLCTQSWLHALLFEPVRLAWALRAPIHVVNAVPAVQEGLRFLEAYALGG